MAKPTDSRSVSPSTSPLSQRSALDTESLKHPNAFMGQDGRTYYKYEIDGDQYILPKPIEEMKEQDFYDLSFPLIDSQVGRIPQNLTVTFKDPQWAGHWFNKKARDGARIGTARTLGFVPAKIEDLDMYWKGLNDKDGAVEDHDLVLMKVHKAKLYFKFAEAIKKAERDGGIEGYKNHALQSLENPANRKREPFYLTRQATQEFQGVGPVVPLTTVET